MRSHREKQIEIITGWIRKHVVEEHTPSTLIYRELGTANCYLRYDIIGRNLVVTGDMGSAVYQWSQQFSFEWLAGLEADYFIGKCQASEEGVPFKDWDFELAEMRFKEFRKQLAPDLGRKLKDILEECGGIDHLPTANREEWNRFAYEHLQDLWPDLDGIYDIGQGLALRGVCHWYGIKTAMKSITESKTATAGIGGAA